MVGGSGTQRPVARRFCAAQPIRLVSRQMQKLTGIVSGEKNRLHKLLTDAGIRLSVVVSDIHGKSARTVF